VKFPEDVRELLARRYKNLHRTWFAGGSEGGRWPLQLALGVPTEREARQQFESMRAWVSAWESLRNTGNVEWCDRRWTTLGAQRLPHKLVLRTPEEVADWIGETSRWRQARARYLELIGRWPTLQTCLQRQFDVLADYSDNDFEKLESILGWIESNPKSGLYIRQIPVKGLHGKWIENRTALIGDLVAGLRPDQVGDLDFFQLCGIRRPPQMARVRLLDRVLKEQIGGLEDFTAPIEEVASLSITPTRVYVVENVQTALAFHDLSLSVVLLGLGYNVDVLGRIPWIGKADCVYWGDLDTHGFAILNRARSVVPRIRSLLMDEDTLLSHRELWGTEDEQYLGTELLFLTVEERTVYDGLKRQLWGANVRLEQERISWDYAWDRLQKLETIRVAPDRDGCFTGSCCI
jgi:hypothetical protein